MEQNVKAKRIPGFDSLRFYMVAAVVMLHGAMSYMAYVPPWWYVINPEQSSFFTVLTLLLDAFPMSVLFFLAGYFALPSLKKKGAKNFLKNKWLHIGIPWVLGVLLAAPFFAYASMRASGYPAMPPAPFFLTVFLGAGYQQGVYWFLMVLFAFFIVFAVCETRKAKRAGTVKKAISPAADIVLLFAASTLTYVLSVRFIMPAAAWLNIGFILYFQPARFIGYAGIFALGIRAFTNRWFENKLLPNISIWALTACIAAFLVVCRAWYWAPVLSPLANTVIDAGSYNLLCLSMTIFLSLLAFEVKSASAASKLSPYSYGLYWVHQILLMPCVYVLIPCKFPLFLKWGLAVCTTLLLGTWINRFVFKKAPLLKKIF
jgi:hypothetical protein